MTAVAAELVRQIHTPRICAMCSPVLTVPCYLEPERYSFMLVNTEQLSFLLDIYHLCLPVMLSHSQFWMYDEVQLQIKFKKLYFKLSKIKSHSDMLALSWIWVPVVTQVVIPVLLVSLKTLASILLVLILLSKYRLPNSPFISTTKVTTSFVQV